MSAADENTVAAVSNQTLVLVTTNHGPAKWITFDLSAFTYKDGGVLCWGSEFKREGGDRHMELKGGWQWGVGHTTLTAFFKADSVQTFEIQGIMPR